MEALTRQQLLARLGSVRALDKALLEGTWQRVLRGAYVRGPAAVDDLRVRTAAARVLLPPRSLVAGRCLLWLLGIDVLPPGLPVLEVVVERGATPPRRHGLVARSTLLPRRDRQSLGGLPVLRPARAVADLLRELPLAEAVVTADAVARADLCPLHDLRAELVRHHAGLRGVRRAHRALDLADARAESPPESRSRVLLVLAGLAPVPQYEVRGADGRWIARVDLAFPEAKVAVEYDGRAVHLQGPAFVHERRRQNALVAAGWVVLRYTAADLRHRPEAIVAEVRRAVQQAAA